MMYYRGNGSFTISDIGFRGKLVVFCPIQCILESRLFSRIIVVTKEAYITYLIHKFLGDRVGFVSVYPKNVFL